MVIFYYWRGTLGVLTPIYIFWCNWVSVCLIAGSICGSIMISVYEIMFTISEKEVWQHVQGHIWLDLWGVEWYYHVFYLLYPRSRKLHLWASLLLFYILFCVHGVYFFMLLTLWNFYVFMLGTSWLVSSLSDVYFFSNRRE